MLSMFFLELTSDFGSMKDGLDESRQSQEARAAENRKLMEKLERQKGEVSDQVNGLLANMMNINPEDVLSEEEIKAHLT